MLRAVVGFGAILLVGCGGGRARVAAPQAAEARDERLAHRLGLPAGSAVGDLVLGYEGTLFATDPHVARLYAVRGGRAELLAQATELVGARALLLDGGTLVIGSRAALLGFDLKARTLTPIAAVGPVLGVALDHVGYYVVRTPDRLLRVTPKGEVSELPVPPGPPPASLGFDAAGRRLLAFDAAGRVRALDYLALTREDRALWAARDAREMHGYELHGFSLDGAEYWPYVGDRDIDYPKDVLWGFYPEAGVVFEGEAAAAAPTAAAQACALRAYRELRTWLETDPARLHEAARLVGSSRFYLWTNDYSKASQPYPFEVRPNKFWFWERKPAVIGRIPGFWKWESTVMQDGRCLTPAPEQVAAYLEERLTATGK